MAKTRQEKLAELVNDIKALAPELKKLCDAARDSLAAASTEPGLQIQYFRQQILAYSMLRLRHFIEHNLINNTSIETMATLAVCRYTFELVVWLKLMEKDDRFALLFNRESIRGHIDNLKENISLLENERSFYISQADTETKLHQQAIEEIKASDRSPDEMGKALASRLGKISDYLDQSLDSRLLLYYEEIAENGYGYVASFIEKKALPPIQRDLTNAKSQLADFDQVWSNYLSEMKKNKKISQLFRIPTELEQIKWKQAAKFAEMEADFDFMYSYTSRLLHATPSSVMTLEQNLRKDEFLTFWRYIRNQFRWIADLGLRVFSVLNKSQRVH
jgi:hypothetical protein